ncbi:RNA polymerase subunit sigma-24 [Spirochaetia bacterium]|nr:RNA polymerase subunit sigma-24 [Spirochaetia bacterium]GHU34406.1 RNA polymerase subunit sigma-24 [Spirochaetia bacterium]
MPQTNVAQTFSTFHEKLSNFIRKRVSIAEDAEDILQEVFYQFTRVNNLGKTVEQTAAWLYRVARNLIINKYIKKNEVQFPISYDEDDNTNFLDEITDVLFAEETTPETEYLRSLVLEEIKSAVNELPQEQREVFELTEYYDMPVKEIAKNTGVSINTVLSRKHYAVVHLRKTLKELYENVVGN